ncbi:MAG TPA: hypothetical protein VKU19_31580 [Bryobacteraceae bacterium]|nr:hypothetical protein [Bryobacteraceae bacterium]
MALLFDRFLESIQRAVEQSDYAFDSYWLPWREEKPEPKGGDAKSADAEEVQKWQEKMRGQPGVLLFRGPKSGDTGLIVLLVGESPVSGVDTASFRGARTLLAAWSESASIQVIGPTFSGSLASLKTIIGGNGAVFQIISGTTTDSTAIADFSSNVNFKTVIHSDTCAVAHFFDYLKGRGIRNAERPEVALLLSEDGTHFGKQFSSPDTINIRFPREISRFRNAYSEGSSQKEDSSAGGIPRLQFLPLRLKGESQARDSLPSFSGSQMPVSQQAVLREVITTIQREKIKFAGIAATDPLDMIFLARFLRVAAPDTRLFIFDADLLFVEASDTIPLTGTMFVTTYPLTDINQSWTSLKPYARRESRILFSSRYGEGVYNATRALMRSNAKPASKPTSGDDDNSTIRRSTDLLDYVRFDDPESDEAPLWLTVLGRDGFWPLAFLTNHASGHHLRLQWQRADFQEGEHARPRLNPPSRAWMSIYYMLTLLCFGTGWLLVASNVWPPVGDRGLLSACPDRPGALARAFYLSFGGLSLAAAYVSFVFPLWVPGAGTLLPFPVLRAIEMPVASPPEMPWISQMVAMFLVGACFAPIFALWKKRFGHLWKDVKAMSAANCVYSTLTIGAFTSFTMFLLLGYRVIVPGPAPLGFPSPIWGWLGYDTIAPLPGFGEGLFFLYRSMWLGSGVSPVQPLIITFLGLTFGAWVQTQRLRAPVDRRPVPPELDDSQKSLTCRIENTIYLPLFSGRDLLFGVCLGIVASNTIRIFRHNQTLESLIFDHILGIAIMLLETMTYFAWSRFVFLWIEVRRLLNYLEQSRLRDAFSRFPSSYSWSPIWLGNSAMRRYFLIQRALESLRAVKQAETGPLKEKLTEQFTGIEKQVTELMSSVNSRQTVSGAALDEVQASLQGIGKAIIADLQQNDWAKGKSDSFDELRKSKPGEEATEREKKELSHHKLKILKEEFVANRYLAYLRYVLVQMNNLLALVIVGFILGIVALNSYPFQSRRLMDTAVIFMLLLLGSGVVAVFMQMDRNALLSRISKTRPGHLDSGFFLRVASYGALPLVTVMASQFPSIGHFLFSWVQPAIEALR